MIIINNIELFDKSHQKFVKIIKKFSLLLSLEIYIFFKRIKIIFLIFDYKFITILLVLFLLSNLI